MTRQEAISQLDLCKSIIYASGRDWLDERDIPMLDMAIEALQERQTGEWKEVYAESDYRDGWIEFTCENCEYQHGLESGQYGWHYGDDIPWKYCPICGTKMEVQDD